MKILSYLKLPKICSSLPYLRSTLFQKSLKDIDKVFQNKNEILLSKSPNQKK